MSILANRLREYRKKNKLTQKDVADYLGITESGYGYYEQDRNKPSLETLRKLAKKYNVSVAVLTGEEEESDEQEFQAFIKDPELKRWYKQLPESDEEDLRKLRKMWEIIKSEETD